ncbi:MAG: hypothetical protein C5B59_18280 [Bacteroidetes bacterium]|nr:MAG: hypothetical protein C5B59_18280 [Bacteroidota bacterium]
MKPVDQYLEDPFDFFLSSPLIDTASGKLYFASSDGFVYALNATNGRLIWKFKTNGIIHAN